jgi:PAS domain S-box-containing protein
MIDRSKEASVMASASTWYVQAMERLVEVVQRLSLARNLDSVMGIARSAARALTGADGATFVLRDGEQCFYADEDAIAPLWKGQRFPMSACISGWVMHNRSAVGIADIYADPRVPADAYRPTFVRSLAMVPIRTLEPIGAIGNYWASAHAPTADELRVLQALADTTAVAMENVRLYAELEARVAQRTAELQAILDHVDTGIAFVADGRVERINPRMARLLGAPTADVLRACSPEALLRAADDDAAFAAALRRGSGAPYTAELRLHRLHGEPFWARVAARPVHDATATDATIWAVDDISEAKARERSLDDLRRAAEAATQSKSDFLASMSHELRTPLNAILGFSEVLRDGLAGELAPRQHEYISDIYDSGEHLLALINDVLDLSKVEAGRMTLEPEAIDVGALLHAATSVVKEKALAHNLSLQVDLADDLGTALLDARKCRQVVYNLLSNAVKFTPDGGSVVLRARVVRAAQAQRALAVCDRVAPPLPPEARGSLLQIEVVDTGIGMTADAMQRVFEPFVQIDSSLSRQYQGTGLGLTLVRRLCALQGGAVGLRSHPGQGSTFSVWLPLRDAEPIPAPTLPPPEIERGRALALVVDDDPRAAELIRLQLDAADCSVMVAPSAEVAVELLSQVQPQLLVLDILLPGIDGWELLGRLKADPSLASIPVLVVSIIADSGRGLALGAVDALQKPVPAAQLRAALQRLGIAPPRADGRSACVLAVDDEPTALELVRTLLEADGCRVLCASNGAQALQTARADLPDLVILDLMMPGMSGFELIAALRADDSTEHIPLIVLTAKDLDQAERSALQRQACAVIEKSRFSAARLRAALKRSISPA